MRGRVWAIALLLPGCGEAGRTPADDPLDDSAETARAPDTEPGEQTPANVPPAAQRDVRNAGACLLQDGRRIPENAIRAIGTEPFWAADVEGRCVTYSTPENQEGTRVWTRFDGTARSGRWTGTLDEESFVMVTRPESGCSDGMSDKSYSIAVTLTVRGERRRGCAELL